VSPTSNAHIIRAIKARRMGWVGSVALMVEKVGTYRAFVVTPEGRRLLGRSRHRWVDNSKIDLLEIG
jgi:hypothetical protein